MPERAGRHDLADYLSFLVVPDAEQSTIEGDAMVYDGPKPPKRSCTMTMPVTMIVSRLAAPQRHVTGSARRAVWVREAARTDMDRALARAPWHTVPVAGEQMPPKQAASTVAQSLRTQRRLARRTLASSSDRWPAKVIQFRVRCPLRGRCCFVRGTRSTRSNGPSRLFCGSFSRVAQDATRPSHIARSWTARRVVPRPRSRRRRTYPTAGTHLHHPTATLSFRQGSSRARANARRLRIAPYQPPQLFNASNCRGATESASTISRKPHYRAPTGLPISVMPHIPVQPALATRRSCTRVDNVASAARRSRTHAEKTSARPRAIARAVSVDRRG
jgi:hypothetical protein